MSWFSNPFAASLGPPEAQQNGSDDDEEDEPSPGKGVREDLSELTKTFSRQLWGVASFLAPPPQPRYQDSSSDDGADEASMAPSAMQPRLRDESNKLSKAVPRRLYGSSISPPSTHDVDDESSMPLHTDLKPPVSPVIADKGAASMADEESSMHHRQIKQANHPLLTEGMALSEELVDVDFEISMDEALEDHAESLTGPDVKLLKKEKYPQSSLHLLQHESSDISRQNAAHGLTGISRDFAELKGTMTGGFSRILKVVREEVGQEETFESHQHDGSGDEEIADDTAGSRHIRKFQGINTFLRPLFSNVLPQDEEKKVAEASLNDDDEDEASEDGFRENRTSQISSRAHASRLHDTFIDGFKGISDFASSLISVNLDLDDEKGAQERERSLQVAGITDEVLTFARNISMHPETWLDFPLFSYNDEDGEFVMSVAQKQHVSMLELMVPRLAALRAELCPDCMSEGSFWKIYFVLLHSRLHKMDAVILSTPKIMEARARLLKKLEEEGEVEEMKIGRRKDVSISNRKEAVSMRDSGETSSSHSALEVQASDFGQLEDIETDAAEEVQNKSVLVNTIKLAPTNYKGDDAYTDQWLREKPISRVHSASLASRSEEDVSFSDLEEEDEPTSKSMDRSDSTHSFGWIQLSKNQSEEDFEGLRAAGKAENRGSKREDVGSSAQDGYTRSSAQASKKQDQKSESSDWSTLEDDDVASGE